MSVEVNEITAPTGAELDQVHTELSAKMREVYQLAADNGINFIGVIDRGDTLGCSFHVTKESGYQMQVAAAVLSGDDTRAFMLLAVQATGGLLSGDDDEDEE